MLRTDLPDHRRASEADVLAALRERDPLALAEVYHRTIPAAHAAARRLLSGSAEVEALLRAVYSELWQSPPGTAALEGWVRQRCFELASEDLRERGAAPASPSLATLLADLPTPEVRYLDAAERVLADLDEHCRRALLLAHDAGVATVQQDGHDPAAALIAALTALAGPDPAGDDGAAHGCDDVASLGDWVFGLLDPDRAADIAATVATRPECAALVKTLRRGRRRLEGLPPTPDMGQRVLVVVLAGAPPTAAPAAASGPAPTAAVAAPGLPSALDEPDPAPGAQPDLQPQYDEDTGDLSAAVPAAAADDEAAAYAALAELDEERLDDAADLADDEDGFDGDEPDGGRRSFGRRLVAFLLGVLFVAAGVALGLFLGYTYMPRLFDLF